MILSVFADNVIDDLRSSVLAEIDIKIRHTDAFGVQKPFKQQIISDRINAGDADTVSA